MIYFRNFLAEQDLQIQSKIWLEATKILPWPWKPNKTQKWFFDQKTFDPKLKMFAVNDESNEIVGYISSIFRDTYVPMGFPWILQGYNEEIQHTLFDTVFNYIRKEYNRKEFLQRFRSDWKKQINFFEEKGFYLSRANPIYILDLDNNKISLDKSIDGIECSSSINEVDIKGIYDNDSSLHQDSLQEYQKYYMNDIDIDLTVLQRLTNHPKALICVTTREDVKYSEIVFWSTNDTYKEGLEMILEETIKVLLLKGIKHVSITVKENSTKIDLLKEFGFIHRSDSVFYTKTLT
jgi:hypothetical protein